MIILMIEVESVAREREKHLIQSIPLAAFVAVAVAVAVVSQSLAVRRLH